MLKSASREMGIWGISAVSYAISGLVTTALGAGGSMGCAVGETEGGQVRSHFVTWYTSELRLV